MLESTVAVSSRATHWIAVRVTSARDTRTPDSADRRWKWGHGAVFGVEWSDPALCLFLYRICWRFVFVFQFTDHFRCIGCSTGRERVLSSSPYASLSPALQTGRSVMYGHGPSKVSLRERFLLGLSRDYSAQAFDVSVAAVNLGGCDKKDF